MFRVILAFALLLMVPSIGAAADTSPNPVGAERIVVTVPDLPLVERDGRSVRFASDVIDGRIAVVIPFYTTCPTSYPILIFSLKRLQEALGERLGKNVVLVAVTVDPRTDTPERLTAYAARQQAQPGWFFLTGERADLGTVLWKMGLLLSTNIDEHNHIPVTVVGRSGGPWLRVHGFPSPERLMEVIGAVSVAEGE